MERNSEVGQCSQRNHVPASRESPFSHPSTWLNLLRVVCVKKVLGEGEGMDLAW